MRVLGIVLCSVAVFTLIAALVLISSVVLVLVIFFFILVAIIEKPWKYPPTYGKTKEGNNDE